MSWSLANLPREQFVQLYGDQVDPSLFEREPVDDQDYLHNYLPSKLWRLNNLYTIIDKQGAQVPFRMNYAQHLVYAASLEHSRVIILKSRQQGISTFWLISFLDDGLVNTNFQVGLMAQGKNEASTLLRRVGMAWDNFPAQLKGALGLGLAKDNSEEQGFSNGSTLFIRTSFRSATLQRLHVSELGKIANSYPLRAKEVKTGTLQAIAPGNTAVLESTAEGDNMFKHMWDAAVEAEERAQRKGGKLAGKEFKPVFLSWVNDPDCRSSEHEEPNQSQAKYFAELEAELNIVLSPEQKSFWIQQQRELGVDIYQEYPATPTEAFTKVNDGSYYGAIYAANVVAKGRVMAGLHDENLPVHVAMDLGMDDTFTLVYFQKWRDEWRVIDEYTASGEGLEHYVDQMFESGYSIGEVICPHDIQVRDLSAGGKTRLAIMRELGVKNLRVLPRLPVVDGIEQFRVVLKNLWIDERCTYLIGCIKNYSKEYDESTELFKNKPNHNKWSHGADALRYMALANVSGRTSEEAARESRYLANDLGMADGMAF
jgi:hypothetical protein